MVKITIEYMYVESYTTKTKKEVNPRLKKRDIHSTNNLGLSQLILA